MIKLLKLQKNDLVEPIMVTDNNANAHCVWQSEGVYCYSRFNGTDWEYLNDYKVVNTIPPNAVVPKNGLCADINGNPYIVWAKSNLVHIFGQLSYLYLTYWDNYQWKDISSPILLEVLYGSSLVFFNNDLYIGSLILKNGQYLFSISVYKNNIFTQLNTCVISALDKEVKVLLRKVNDDYIYCFWDCSDGTNYWIEHVVYDAYANVFYSTVTRKIGLTNNNIPTSGFDFVPLPWEFESSSSSSASSESSISSSSSSSISSSSSSSLSSSSFSSSSSSSLSSSSSSSSSSYSSSSSSSSSSISSSSSSSISSSSFSLSSLSSSSSVSSSSRSSSSSVSSSSISSSSSSSFSSSSTDVTSGSSSTITWSFSSLSTGSSSSLSV